MKNYHIFILFLFIFLSCDLFEPEQEEPTVKITSPKNNSYVHEVVEITADADDNKGIVFVEFYIDGETNSEMKDLIAPYCYNWNVINLPDSSTHTIYAKAIDTDDNISSSKMVTVTVNNQLGIPDPVQLEVSISPIDSSVILEWSPSTIDDFGYYSIYRDINPGVSNISDHLSTINKDTTTKYIDINVLDNSTYYYVIYLVDQYGFRSKSNEVEITVPNITPESIILHNPSNVTDSTMLLIWDKSQIHDFQKYSLYRSLSSNPDLTSNLIFETTDINQNSYFDGGLENNQVYFYRIFLYDSGNLYSMSNVVFDTAKTKIFSIPTYGLVAYYPFNGNADDESGNGNNGVVTGTVHTTDRFGSNNRAFLFNGTDSYITLSTLSDLELNGNFSLSAWIKWEGSTERYQRIITKWGTGSENNGQFILSTNYDLHSGGIKDNSLIMFLGSGNQYKFIQSSFIPDNDWHHIVATFDNEYIKIHIDCELNISQELTIEYTSFEQPVYIGGGASGGVMPNYIFNGKIDDIIIYNRVLTSSEIDSLYHEKGWE